MVENIPSLIMKDVAAEEATKIQAKLAEAGAKIELE
jgi:ribosomal protein L7/L12